ncbi:allophanate hydrolase [uncultured Cohaesibacter sp.]|uniref:allophanate hydrolase n=1 Tax=uncultured Cohaesibacter sp. TaxID=1002546 RepID=UPI002930A39B|nr:allophanate hydrolase [uncultured Cohaesibacter sp.]
MTTPMTISDLHKAYAEGTPPEEIIAAVYARIAEVADPGIFITLRDEQDVLGEAKALGKFDSEKPLWGIPFAVKDNIDVAGLPTTAACPAWEYAPSEDAFVVARLRKAGAIVIGKTNLDQFATGLVGVRTPYGAPKNALDPAIVPGGSSGGSGVSVAHGIVSFALGTDTAGSGRVPAALNNIVGLKPSLGSWSASGSVPACRSTETISAFALTVEDAYRVHQVACGFDEKDAYSKAIEAPGLFSIKTPLTIGIPNKDSIKFMGDDAQAASFAQGIALLEAAGHKVEPLDFTPFYDIAEMLYEGAWVAERNSVIEQLMADDPEAILAVTRKIVGKANNLTATDAFRGFYRLRELSRKVEPLLDRLDLLCVPSIPTFYSVADLEADPVTPNSNLGTYTNFVNLLDMCGLAVPIPARSDGRPGSVTLLARSGKDALIASLSTCLEGAGERKLGATSWSLPDRHPVAELPAGHVKLAVCGAHLEGLPLNWQLTDRGAFLLEETTSAPFYRFYSLAGEGVKRPGMIRTTEQQVNGVAVEVWAMPLVELGSFLAGIPAPLGLGKVELASGEEVCGFICEASGAEGAEDITAIGSWRRFMKE